MKESFVEGSVRFSGVVGGPAELRATLRPAAGGVANAVTIPIEQAGTFGGSWRYQLAYCRSCTASQSRARRRRAPKSRRSTGMSGSSSRRKGSSTTRISARPGVASAPTRSRANGCRSSRASTPRRAAQGRAGEAARVLALARLQVACRAAQAAEQVRRHVGDRHDWQGPDEGRLVLLSALDVRLRDQADPDPAVVADQPAIVPVSAPAAAGSAAAASAAGSAAGRRLRRRRPRAGDCGCSTTTGRATRRASARRLPSSRCATVVKSPRSAVSSTSKRFGLGKTRTVNPCCRAVRAADLIPFDQTTKLAAPSERSLSRSTTLRAGSAAPVKPIVAATKVFEGAARTRFCCRARKRRRSRRRSRPARGRGGGLRLCRALVRLPSTVTARTKPPTARATNAAMPRSQRRGALRAPASSGH